MKEDRSKHLAQITEELAFTLVPFGYIDLRRAAEVLSEAEIKFLDFAAYVEDFCEDIQVQFKDIDVCYLAYEMILQEARNQINEILGVDIINDTDNFYTSGNFMCTSFDYSESSKKQILSWINEIEETRSEEMTKQIMFVKNQLN